MRANGHRLASTDPALLRGVSGWLEFKRSPLDSYGPRMEAHLLDRPGGKDLIRPLYYARLVRIEGVLHLAGREREGRDRTKSSTRRILCNRLGRHARENLGLQEHCATVNILQRQKSIRC